MPEHISTTGFNGIVQINPELWMFGEESRKKGVMYDPTNRKYDIFGWILKSVGYTLIPFLRAPSQFAQKVNERSGSTLRGIASYLTTSTHVDTPLTFELGRANDSLKPVYDIENDIATLLKPFEIGVNFNVNNPTRSSSESEDIGTASYNLVMIIDRLKSGRNLLNSQVEMLNDIKRSYIIMYIKVGTTNYFGLVRRGTTTVLYTYSYTPSIGNGTAVAGHLLRHLGPIRDTMESPIVTWPSNVQAKMRLQRQMERSQNLANSIQELGAEFRENRNQASSDADPAGATSVWNVEYTIPITSSNSWTTAANTSDSVPAINNDWLENLNLGPDEDDEDLDDEADDLDDEDDDF